MGKLQGERRKPGQFVGYIPVGRAYAAAIVLPILSCLITSRVQLLDRIPAALYLASIAIVAWLGMAGSAALCVLLSLVLYNVYTAVPVGRFSLQPDELLREGVIASAGGVIGFLILQLRRTQARLGASEAFYRTTLFSIGDAVIATDREGKVTFMNAVAEVLTGWREAEVKGTPLDSFFHLTHEETGAAVDNPVDRVRLLGEVVGMGNHTLLQQRNGARVPVEDSAAPIRTLDGKQTGIVLVFRDASHRRHAERQQEALLARTRAVEAELRDLLAIYQEQTTALSLAQQAGKCAAWIMDVQKQEVKWLPGGYEIFGRPFADFVGRVRPISLIEPEDVPLVEAALKKTLETGVSFTPEYRIRWPNGEMHWQEARGVLDPDGKTIRGTTFDVTDRKNAEFGLLRIEKLAAVGRISSTIAHEINNPLASVTNLLYLALNDAAVGEPTHGYLLLAQEELSRLSNVTRLTLSYARSQSQARAVDPWEVIESVLFLFRVRLEGKGIDVSRDTEGTPMKAMLFVDEFQRIMTNLVANAIDAVPVAGGKLRVIVIGQNRQVLVAVEDNGSGIPDERKDRIFDPFFTTKEEVGTGIGLWVTKELVEKNGGTITLVTEPLMNQMRTRFEVCFPAVVSEIAEDGPKNSVQKGSRGGTAA